MSPQSATALEDLLRANGLGWTIDRSDCPEKAVAVLERRLRDAAAKYKTRMGVEGPFTPEALVSESMEHPPRIRAFLQALAATGSANMLVMVWRILQGCTIRHVDMKYTVEDSFRLRVELMRSHDDEQIEVFESVDINDATLLRHFGIGEADGKPLFVGFFPLRFGTVQK